MRESRFIDSSGAPRRQEQVRRIEVAHPNVPLRELTLVIRRERLHRETVKLEKKLKEQGL